MKKWQNQEEFWDYGPQLARKRQPDERPKTPENDDDTIYNLHYYSWAIGLGEPLNSPSRRIFEKSYLYILAQLDVLRILQRDMKDLYLSANEASKSKKRLRTSIQKGGELNRYQARQRRLEREQKEAKLDRKRARKDYNAGIQGKIKALRIEMTTWRRENKKRAHCPELVEKLAKLVDSIQLDSPPSEPAFLSEITPSIITSEEEDSTDLIAEQSNFIPL